jgi:hypothetical protein
MSNATTRARSAHHKFDPRLMLKDSRLRLLAKVFGIVIAISAAVWLSSLAQKKREQVSDAKQRAAWASRSVAPPTQSLDSFLSSWGASKATADDAESVRWRAADSRELAASLLAFDAVNHKGRSVVRIDVRRQEGRFSVSAELTK